MKRNSLPERHVDMGAPNAYLVTAAVAGAFSLVLAIIQRCMSSGDRAEAQKNYEIDRADHRSDAIIAELNTRVAELKEECQAKLVVIEHHDQGVEKRNSELNEWRNITAQLNVLLAQKNLQLYLYRRRATEVIGMMHVIEETTKKIHENPDLTYCVQIIAGVIVKMSQEIEVPL